MQQAWPTQQFRFQVILVERAVGSSLLSVVTHNKLQTRLVHTFHVGSGTSLLFHAGLVSIQSPFLRMLAQVHVWLSEPVIQHIVISVPGRGSSGVRPDFRLIVGAVPM